MIASQFVRAAAAALILGGVVGVPAGYAEPADVNPTPPAGQLADTAGSSSEAEAFLAALLGATADMSEPRRAAIAAFYAGRDYAPFWTAADGAELDALRAALTGAPAQGLPAARYQAALDALTAGSGSVARNEMTATEAYLRYANDLSSGILTPWKVDEEISVTPPRPSDAQLLALLDTGSVTDALGAAAPQDPDYRALMAEKVRLEALLDVASPWGPTVPEGPTLHEGESGPRIADLRERLAGLGYVAPVTQDASDPSTAMAFDAALAEQVAAFQRDNGLIDDGAAGRRTLDALNASARDRLAQVVVNLERLRWTDRDLGARRIEVNIPDFTATLYDGDEVPWHSRVVVGEQKTRTPEFSDKMTHMVVNPTWHVPDSIAIRTYLPKLQKDPTVLSRSDMRLFSRSGREINPLLVNFDQYTPESFPFRFKQNPSSANALGQVKFMFPNQFSIYLHDTPHRELFPRDARAFSNGCIRLERPFDLAQVLLRGQVDDPEGAFDGWVAAKSERHVNLDRPVQVHIMYRTAWAEDDGTIRYRADIYGRDAEVFEALSAAGVELPEASAQG